MLPFMSSFAQSICTDSRYEPGGFTLSSTDICHNETVTVTNTGGVENPKYYYNYRGESYEEIQALGGAAPDFSGVTKPGLYQVIQVGKKNGKETVFCQEVKVRNSTTAVFSYNFCTSPTRIEIIIPSHPLNDYSQYQIELNGTLYGATIGAQLSLPVQNISNSILVTGVGGPKTCNSLPIRTVVPSYSPSGRDYEYYPQIRELRVSEDKSSIRIDLQGQFEQTYDLFRYEGGQPNVGTRVKTVKPSTVITDTPPNPDRAYCYFVQPAVATCGPLFPLRSADICSVPLSSPLPPTSASNYLQWNSYAPPSGQVSKQLQKISEGAAVTPITLTNEISYTDNHGDCSKKNCYRIRITYTGVINGTNYSGVSLSNQLCFDHRLELTDYPPNTFVNTENKQNLVRFDPGKDSPYNLARWELFKHDGTAFSLLETLLPGPVNPSVTDAGPVSRSEKYKVRYIDECENISAFSPEVSSVFLSEDGDNILDWTGGKPFADADILNYEVIYYDGDNQNNILTTRQVNAAVYTHPVNTALFTNTGTFRVKALGNDGKISFSNPVTITVKGSLFLPTAFSPNNDGLNDTFAAKGNLADIRNFRLEIFSSSGQKIADITDPVQGWDGRLPNGDQALFGNYLYNLKAQMNNGQEISKNGSFVLLY